MCRARRSRNRLSILSLLLGIVAVLSLFAGPAVFVALLPHPAAPPPGSDNFQPSPQQVGANYLVFHVLPWTYVGVAALAVVLGHLSLVRLGCRVRGTPPAGIGIVALVVGYVGFALTLLFALFINFVQI